MTTQEFKEEIQRVLNEYGIDENIENGKFIFDKDRMQYFSIEKQILIELNNNTNWKFSALMVMEGEGDDLADVVELVLEELKKHEMKFRSI
jgi:hypothetical protein